MPGGLHPHAHADASRLQLSVELLGFSITVVQWSFTALPSLFHKKCNLLKARVVIYAYNHHVRLLSPEPAVVKQPQFTRVKEPTLLCNHLFRFPSSHKGNLLSGKAITCVLRPCWRWLSQLSL